MKAQRAACLPTYEAKLCLHSLCQPDPLMLVVCRARVSGRKRLCFTAQACYVPLFSCKRLPLRLERAVLKHYSCPTDW